MYMVQHQRILRFGVEGGDLGEEGSSSNNPGQLMTQQQSSTVYIARTVL